MKTWADDLKEVGVREGKRAGVLGDCETHERPWPNDSGRNRRDNETHSR